MPDIFDFGFTAIDESELEVVQNAKANECSLEETQSRLTELYNSILPLLENLKKNPEKDYIYWPNRVDKVEEFKQHILKIVEGK